MLLLIESRQAPYFGCARREAPWAGFSRSLWRATAGIIIDAFSSRREALQDQERRLRDVCFVCGLGRAKFEAARPAQTYFFSSHVAILVRKMHMSLCGIDVTNMW